MSKDPIIFHYDEKLYRWHTSSTIWLDEITNLPKDPRNGLHFTSSLDEIIPALIKQGFIVIILPEDINE